MKQPPVPDSAKVPILRRLSRAPLLSTKDVMSLRARTLRLGLGPAMMWITREEF